MRVLDALDYYRIEYVSKGSNVKKGWVNIHCPYCGAGDPSHHLGINTENGFYGCWRDSTHKGRIEKLIAYIARASIREVKEQLGIKVVLEENWGKSILARLNGKVEPIAEVKGGVEHLEFPEEFHKIRDNEFCQPFLDYLEVDREFDDVLEFAKFYNLQCARSGAYRKRVIFPVYMYEEKKLVTWVGRTIFDDTPMKYKDLSIEESIVPPKRTLMNHTELLKGGKKLIITEGVIDALKIDWELRPKIKGTCVFTKRITEDQIYLIKELSPKYKEIILLLDDDAYLESMRCIKSMRFIKNISLKTLPNGVKDAGSLNSEDIRLIIPSL